MGKRRAMTVLRFGSARLALVGLTGALACASAEPAPQPEPAAAPPPAAATPASRSAALDAQAREIAAISGAEVERKSDALIVRFGSESLFDPSSAELSAGGQERIGSLARALASDPRERVIVRGHADVQRDERSSQTLSEELADSVRNFLVAEGVVPSRITAVGFAASQPVATNATAEGRQQNRRIEIELWPEPAALEGGGAQ